MTVAPEYLAGFAVVLLIFAAATALALPLAARLTGYRGLGVGLCLAPAIGTTLLIAAGLAAYRFPSVSARPFIAIAILLLLGGWFWIRDRSRLASLPINWIALGAGLAISLAFYFSAQANRLSLLFLDEPIHLGITATIVEGNYPVRSPWSPDVAAAYHYAGDLHAAILTSVSGLPVWIVAELQHPWVALGLALIVFGVVIHATGSRVGALAAAALAAYSPGIILLGWPALGAAGAAFPDSLASLGARLAEIGPARYELSTGPSNLVFPQRTLGFTLLTLLVHSWTLSPFRRNSTAAIFGVGIGLLAVFEVGMFAIGFLALIADAGAYVLTERGKRVKASIRVAVPVAFAVAVALIAGGPVTDAVVGPAGIDAGRSVALQIRPSWDLLNPVRFAQPLAAQSFAAAVELRWIHLAILAAGLALLSRNKITVGLCAVGIAGGVLFQSVAYTVHDDASRLVIYSSFFSAVAIVAFLPGFIRKLPTAVAVVAGSAIVAFAAIPTLIPELIPAVRLTVNGVAFAPIEPLGLSNRLAERSRYALEFNTGKSIFASIRETTPADARILTPWPAALTIATGRFGVFAPPGAVQNEPYPGPEFIDAWSSLAFEPIAALGAEYLHLTADAADVLDRQGIQIEEPGGFRLLVDTFGDARPEFRHRLYAIEMPAPYAGDNSVTGLSRRLRADSAIFMGDGLSPHATAALAIELRDHTLVRRSAIPGHLRVPITVEQPGRDTGYAIFPEWYRPIEQGMTQHDAVWHGAGSRLYDLSTELRWSGPIRGDWTEVKSQPGRGIEVLAFLPERSAIEINRDGESTRVDGRGGLISTVIAGSESTIRMRAINDGPPPFVMYGPNPPGAAQDSNPVPGIAYQAGWDGSRVVVDIWWLSAGAATESLGAEWLVVPAGGGPPDPNDAEARRWEAGLNVRAKSDLIREFFTLSTSTPGYVDPLTRESVFRDRLDPLGPGTYVAYLYIVSRTAESRSAHMAVPVFRFENGAREPAAMFSGVSSLEPLDRPDPVWLHLK